MEAAEAAGASTGDEAAASLKQQGNDCLKAGKEEEALSLYLRALEFASKKALQSQIHSNCAHVLLKGSGREEEALSHCDGAIQCDASNVKACWRGATAAQRLDRHALAIDYCTRGLAIEADNKELQALLKKSQIKLKGEVERQRVVSASSPAPEKASICPDAKTAATEGAQEAAQPKAPKVVVGRHLRPAPMPKGLKPRIAGVLSTYIGTEHRLVRLSQCFASIACQSQKLAAFFMVWSAPEEVAPSVEKAIGQLRKALAPSPMHTLRQTRRTSQFYDIRWLYEELIHQEPVGTWLVFTDDDDLWGPQRVEAYTTVITAHGYTPGVTAVCATHKVRPTSRTKVAASAREVQMHLASGDAKHCGGVHVEEEFFDFACPRESLGAFFALCNDESLLHPFADLRFTRFMSEYYDGGRVMYFPTDTVWVYYYSTAYRTPEDQGAFEQFASQDQASTVVRVRPEDLEEARAICKKNSGGRDPSQAELDEMADLVSSLRQNIDGVLIRHFPDEPLSTGEMKRIAVGQCQGNFLALKMCEGLARRSCKRFGIQLE